MDITFGPMFPSTTLGFETPETVEIGARIFYWNEKEGCYQDIIGIDLYIEPVDHDGTLTADSYWEFEDFTGVHTSRD